MIRWRGRPQQRRLLSICAIVALGWMPAHGQQASADQGPGALAIGSFFGVILVTLSITWWAARRTRTAHEFYAAGSRISARQNGLAIAGDFMSAATFLGLTAFYFASGVGTAIYAISPTVAFGVLMFWLADKLRNLGRYTFADVLSYRLDEKPIRAFAAIGTLVSAVLYLLVQLIGSGELIHNLFGISYEMAVIIVGSLMVLYVAFGGMLATTWVQIIKALLLIAGIALLAVLALAHFDFSLSALYAEAVAKHPLGMDMLGANSMNLDLISALSLAAALAFGIGGSPHILMRFFTVPNAAAARNSAAIAATIVSVVFLMIFFVIAVAAVALVTGNAEFFDSAGKMIGGPNMAAIHLSKILGGEILLGVMSAIAFATILAVVAGLTLASASAISHDLYARVLKNGQASEADEVRVSRLATLFIGVIAILLGIAFEGQHIVVVLAIALAVAASANFPVLILCLYWKPLTTRGAIAGGVTGLASAILFVALGPAVWVGVLGNAEPVFPYAYPAIFSMGLAFLLAIVVSLTDPVGKTKAHATRFLQQQLKCELGDI